MSTELRAIDCDVHPGVPDIRALAPYLADHWRDAVAERGIPSLESISYPPMRRGPRGRMFAARAAPRR